MASQSKIEWTSATWNPTTGCDRISAGCDNCYALTMAARLKKMGSAKYQTDGDPRTSGPGFGVAVHQDALDVPLRWRLPRRVFVDSMSDLFHARVPDEFIARVFATMAATPRHTYQLLTKRPRRMRRLLNSPAFADLVFGFADGWETRQRLTRPTRDDPMPALPHVWLGVSVEDQEHAEQRVPDLLGTPAAVRFLSCEPLLGPVGIGRWLTREPVYAPGPGAGGGAASRRLPAPVNWVIAGGESGPKARPAHPDWFRWLRDECAMADVAFFFKQWGAYAPAGRRAAGMRPDRRHVLVGDPLDGFGPRVEMERVGAKAAGRLLDGRTWDQMPAAVHA